MTEAGINPRRIQVTLRGFLIAITLLMCAIALLVRRAEYIEGKVRSLESRGAQVTFKGELVGGSLHGQDLERARRNREIYGAFRNLTDHPHRLVIWDEPTDYPLDRSLDDVASIGTFGRINLSFGVTKQQAVRLAGFPTLREIAIHSDSLSIEAVQVLLSSPYLKRVDLMGCRNVGGDFGKIQYISPSIKSIALQNTGVSPEILTEISSRFPHCSIEN